MSFDSTGCFHWCVGRTAEECTLTRQGDNLNLTIIHTITIIHTHPHPHP